MLWRKLYNEKINTDYHYKEVESEGTSRGSLPALSSSSSGDNNDHYAKFYLSNTKVIRAITDGFG